MPTHKQLSLAHQALSEWANTILMDVVMPGHALGYPSITTIGRWIQEGGILISDQPAKAKVPNIKQTPERVRVVHQIYKELSPRLQAVIWYKYMCDGSETERLQAYMKETGFRQRTYYNRWEEAREIVAMRLFRH